MNDETGERRRGEERRKGEERRGPTTGLRHYLSGLAMGAADIVPGVSGGTVALILGIYERLVTAVSRVDRIFVQRLLRGRVREALAHVDAAFLATLLLGIGTGVVGLANVMNRLLTEEATRPPTLAAFFGLILASSFLVLRLARVAGRETGAGAGAEATGSDGIDRGGRRAHPAIASAAAAGGAAFAFWLTGLRSGGGGDPTLGYAFLSGAIAICAMILPGISGAFLLVLLGMYVPITGILRRLPELDVSAGDGVLLAVFAGGCAVGILSFSRLLRWLLARHGMMTLSVLAGFMVGSLRKIWPFQRDVTLENLERAGLRPAELAELTAHPERVAELDVKHRVFENAWPSSFGGEELLVLICGIAAIAFVLVVDRAVRARRTT